MNALPPPFDAVWFRFIIGFIIGACLGSFGTMLAYRLPRDMSILLPRSHCPSCKKSLKSRDLVPLLSYLCGKGRCRYCGRVIGTKYLIIEFACSLSGGLIAILIGYAIK
jgi:leader peptidase (prepilin peptidase)/N-methyltransferase